MKEKTTPSQNNHIVYGLLAHLSARLEAGKCLFLVAPILQHGLVFLFKLSSKVDISHSETAKSCPIVS